MASTGRTAPIDELATWVNAYREACTNRDNWGAIADRAKEQIAKHLEEADAEIGTVNGYPTVRYTHVTSNRFDTKRFKSDHPEMVDDYQTTSQSRRFTLIEQVS